MSMAISCSRISASHPFLFQLNLNTIHPQQGQKLSGFNRSEIKKKCSSFFVRCSSFSEASPSTTTPQDIDPELATTAKESINLGLSLFKKGRVKDALSLFEKALSLDPDTEEAKIALYNKACCHSYREEGTKAAEALRKALREHNLKFSVILNDPDMSPFRAMPEFKQLQNEARMGDQVVGSSFRRDLKLLSEVRAPFRGVRRFFYLALCAAAGIATFFTFPRVIRVIQNNSDTSEIWETLGNAAINIGGIIVLLALFIWDNKKEEEQMAQISREETLSRLPLRLSNNRVVELSQLREACRPVILAGKKEVVDRAIQKAEKFRLDLVKRGVLIIPVIWKNEKEGYLRKKGFGSLSKPSYSFSSRDEFDEQTLEVSLKSVANAEKRFKAEAVSPNAWESWLSEQQESEGVKPGENAFIILRLDGRVRKSGLGMPDWKEIINEIPPLESFISKLEK